MEDAIEAAKQAGVSLYAVAQRGGDSEGRRILEALTSGTGGKLELLRKAKEPELSVASLQILARDEYALTFRPPNLQPGFHSMELRAKSAPTLVLRAQPGYYLNPNR